LNEKDQRNLEEMDRIYLDFPAYGSRRMSRKLKLRGFKRDLFSDASSGEMIKDIHFKTIYFWS